MPRLARIKEWLSDQWGEVCLLLFVGLLILSELITGKAYFEFETFEEKDQKGTYITTVKELGADGGAPRRTVPTRKT